MKIDAHDYTSQAPAQGEQRVLANLTKRPQVPATNALAVRYKKRGVLRSFPRGNDKFVAWGYAVVWRRLAPDRRRVFRLPRYEERLADSRLVNQKRVG